MVLVTNNILRRPWKRYSITAHMSVVAVDEGALRSGLKAPQTRLQSLRQQAVVGVQEQHILAFAAGEPAVACPREPLVLLPDQAHPRVTLSHLGGVVRGAVVHHDNLEVGIALG